MSAGSENFKAEAGPARQCPGRSQRFYQAIAGNLDRASEGRDDVPRRPQADRQARRLRRRRRSRDPTAEASMFYVALLQGAAGPRPVTVLQWRPGWRALAAHGR